MNLKAKNKHVSVCLFFLLCSQFIISQTDAYFENSELAEIAFLSGDLEKAAEYYVQILESNNVNSTSKIKFINRLKTIELLSLSLQQGGECQMASKYLIPLLSKNVDKVAVSKAIREIIRCHNSQGLKIDQSLQKGILNFMELKKIDIEAHNQLAIFLSGVYTDEQDLNDFFLLLEYGFIPSLSSLEKEKVANQKVRQRTWIAMGASILMLTLGFFLITESRKKKHIQRENVALLTGKEKENDRLSIDLHDILGYKIVELKNQVKKIDQNQSAEINQLAKSLDQLHESMRYVVQSNLTPQSLKFGVGPALETLFIRVNKLGVVHFELYKHGLDQRIDEKIEKHIFYVIQELVNNVIKHSKAQKATFEISKHKNEISILAEDNGIGYTPSVGTLKTVKSRVTFLNGKVIEEAAIDNGATIIINIPI